MKRIVSIVLAVLMLASLCACSRQGNAEATGNFESTRVTVTDLIGRQVEILPGSLYRRRRPENV